MKFLSLFILWMALMPAAMAQSYASSVKCSLYMYPVNTTSGPLLAQSTEFFTSANAMTNSQQQQLLIGEATTKCSMLYNPTFGSCYPQTNPNSYVPAGTLLGYYMIWRNNVCQAIGGVNYCMNGLPGPIHGPEARACAPPTVTSCSVSGRTIPIGGTIKLYSARWAYPACGETCEDYAEIRTCTSTGLAPSPLGAWLVTCGNRYSYECPN